jgi:hypothetical protein
MNQIGIYEDDWSAVKVELERLRRDNTNLEATLRQVIAALTQPVQRTAETDDLATLQARVSILRADAAFAVDKARKALGR